MSEYEITVDDDVLNKARETASQMGLTLDEVLDVLLRKFNADNKIKRAERYYFPAVFTYEEKGKIAVTFPDLDVATSGANERDALLSARELLGCVLFGMEEEGMDIPVPTPMLKVNPGANERVILVDVHMPDVRSAQEDKFVNRTVILPEWLNAAAMERNLDLSRILQDELKAHLHIGG